jgi:cell division transport system ATP-binding protein
MPLPNDSEPFIEFDHVSKKRGEFRFALADVSFAVGRGEFVLLTGASGSGKSTVLQLRAAIEQPSSGRVRVGGEDLARLKPRALPLLRRSIGILPQELTLLGDRSVLANVMLPALAAGLTAREAEHRARAALARVGLDGGAGSGHAGAIDVAPLRPRELSGGQKQRAVLARAIVNRPALLLADEPTAHLDPQAAGDLLLLLDEFTQAGVTVVMASHGEAAALPAHVRVLALADGKIQP